MALLPPRFHDAISAAPLGPVVKRTEDPVMHVHDWRPSASSKDHVTCSCGQVSLREFVKSRLKLPEILRGIFGTGAELANHD